MLKKLLLLQLLVFSQTMPGIASSDCGKEGVWLQVLGSGGPELDDGRASTGYLIWSNGQARLLVDMGAGSMHNFEQSGASINDLNAILLSHFHVDHSNDLPALVKSSFFSDRDRDLYIFGPTGNNLMPSVNRVNACELSWLVKGSFALKIWPPASTIIYFIPPI